MDKFIVVAFVLCYFIPVQSHYLITTSRVYRTGTIETINVNLHNNNGSWNITATLTLKNKIITTSSKVFQGNSQGTMHIEVPEKVEIPSSEVRNALLSIVGIQIGSREEIFNETQRITLQKLENNLFIQTDKPIYKPGQTIRMRIIGIKPNLKPLVGKIEEVTVTNPTGVRLMQWNNLEFKDGLHSLSLPLSNQPVLGDWKLKAVYKGKEVTKKIEVSKYVLPKFDVTIEPPPFIAVDSKDITGTICGRYTYGQLVSGTIEVTFEIKRNWWWRDEFERKITEKAKVTGCYEFRLTNKDLGLDGMKYSYHGTTLIITATMTEEATGIIRKAEKTETSIVPYRVNLDFSKGTPRFFKPGLPFHGQLRVTSPDGNPISDEKVRITAKNGGKLFYSKNGVSKNGIVEFRIHDVPHDLDYISLDARQGKGEIFGFEFGDTTWYPTAGLHCTPWYSKSWSVIQLQKPKLLKVGEKAKVIFRYATMDQVFTTELHYHVICGGNITTSGKKTLNFVGKTRSTSTTTSPTTTTSTTTAPTTTTTSNTTTSTTTTSTAPTTAPFTAGGRTLWIPDSPGHPGGKKDDSRPKVKHLYKGVGFIKFSVTQAMVPSCRLIAYYVRKDGETIADSIVVDVEDKLENQVFVRFDNSVRKPGQPVKITMAAAQGSTVALSGVDKSVRLLKAAEDLTTSTIMQYLSSQDVGPLGYYQRRRKCDTHWGGGFGPVPLRRARYIYPPYSRSNYVDASKAFQDSGMVYFTDLTVESRPCPKFYGWRSREFGLGGGGGGIPPLSGGGSAGGSGFTFGGPVNGPVAVPFVAERGTPDSANNIKKVAAPVVRKNFPETWLWTEEKISNATGQRTIKAKVPDTITSWHLSAFAMSSKSGMGVSDPSVLTVFQPFFVSFTLPYSVIRGEEVSVIATLFNYMSKCATVSMRLSQTDHFDLNSTAEHKLCICGNEAKSVKYVITPLKLGNIPLKVTVQNVLPSLCEKPSEEAALGISDAVQRKLLVEAEGVRQEYTYNSFICPEDSLFSDFIEVSLPGNYVPGSTHATLSAIGDLLGPSLSGLEGLLRLPTGCGEQNMVHFAPNIYIMQYLENTKQLTDNVKDKAVGFLRTGYQRELTYKRKDGSYSAFGDRDKEGSLWLTAFVVRSFSQARPFIFIDKEEVNSTMAWIKGKQLETGCFRKHGQLFNKALKGGVTSPVTLTAFIVISLLESNIDPKSDVIVKGLKCISAKKYDVIDAYSNAIIAYALTLAKHSDRDEFIKRLRSQAITKDGLMHWEKKAKKLKASPSNAWQSPYYRAPSANIEMTAYALMAMMDDGTDKQTLASVLPIIRWIAKQRNEQGGFSSTQDTCIALQALSKYASFVYGDEVTRMRIDVGYRQSSFHEKFRIEDTNRLVLQRVEIPEKILHSKKIPVDAVGQGCALLQADVSYNIPEVKEAPVFNLSVSVTPHKGRNDVVTSEAGEELCQPLEVNVCAKWLEEDESGMTVIDVKLVSGFSADEESLERLMNRLDLNLMKFELEENKIVLYFNEILSVCFSFIIQQTSVVKKTKPASVKIYEYYDTDNSATTMYNVTEELCLPEPELTTTPPPNPCPLCPEKVDINALQQDICNTRYVMAVRTVKAGQTRFEYLATRKEFSIPNLPKKDVRPITLTLPKDCGCSYLTPKNKALILVQRKKMDKDLKKLNLDKDFVILPRKTAWMISVRDAMIKCTTVINSADP